MQYTVRRYHDEDDYWRIREFLRATYRLSGRRELNWQVYRFDYCRWHVLANVEEWRIEDVTWLWESSDGNLIAVVIPEGKGDVHLQAHPAARSPELDDAMIALAEEQLTTIGKDSRRRLTIWINESDSLRREVALRRGFMRGDWPEYQRRRSLATPIPESSPARGYTIRALGNRDDLPARSYLSWQAFHPDEPDERYEGWEWYLNVQRAPLYRRDLDLVAVAPDGTPAAFATIWFDDVNRTGAFEPVGTAPAHHRRGLGKVLMHEGLRRLRHLGALTAHVGSYSEAAHALYESAGFTEYELLERWTKQL